jgi:hypothetical protein
MAPSSSLPPELKGRADHGRNRAGDAARCLMRNVNAAVEDGRAVIKVFPDDRIGKLGLRHGGIGVFARFEALYSGAEISHKSFDSMARVGL